LVGSARESWWKREEKFHRGLRATFPQAESSEKRARRRGTGGVTRASLEVVKNRHRAEIRRIYLHTRSVDLEIEEEGIRKGGRCAAGDRPFL